MSNQISDLDNLDFTNTKALIAAILHETDSNEAKIQVIKEEIAAGNYQINQEQIANKLLAYTYVMEEAMV